MTPADLFNQYVDQLPKNLWTQFADDIVGVVQYERNRMRRQLTTDRAAYEAACVETSAEIEEARRNGG